MNITRTSPVALEPGELESVTPASITAWFAHVAKRRHGANARPIPADLGPAIYNQCVRSKRGVTKIAAQILHETDAWQAEYARVRNNPGGIGAVNHDPDQALWFPSVEAGVIAHVAHVCVYCGYELGYWAALDPRYQPVKDKGWIGAVKVLADFEQRWAWSPPAKYNATPPEDRYGGMVARLANDLIAFSKNFLGAPAAPFHIGLSPGHWDSTGDQWGGEEKKRTILIHQAVKAELEKRGFRVTEQPAYPFEGTYRDVADWFAQRHAADPFGLLLQLHFQGEGSGTRRGPFGIYPDNDERGDHDLDARELGRDMSQRIVAVSGDMPLYGDGTMSEKDTAAKSLAFFSRTTNARQIERLLLECACSNSNMADRAIVDSPGWYARAAGAIVDAIEARYGKQRPGTPPPPRVIQVETPGIGTFALGHGFLDYYEDFGGLEIDGYPLTNEFQENGITVQYFERSRYEYHPGRWPERYDVLRGRVGAELMEAHAEIARLRRLLEAQGIAY